MTGSYGAVDSHENRRLRDQCHSDPERSEGACPERAEGEESRHLSLRYYFPCFVVPLASGMEDCCDMLRG